MTTEHPPQSEAVKRALEGLFEQGAAPAAANPAAKRFMPRAPAS